MTTFDEISKKLVDENGDLRPEALQIVADGINESNGLLPGSGLCKPWVYWGLTILVTHRAAMSFPADFEIYGWSQMGVMTKVTCGSGGNEIALQFAFSMKTLMESWTDNIKRLNSPKYILDELRMDIEQKARVLLLALSQGLFDEQVIRGTCCNKFRVGD